MRHTALKLTAALLVILGLAGAALVASRLIWPPSEPGAPLEQPLSLGRMDANRGWAWDGGNPMVDGQLTSLSTARLMLTDDGGLNWRAAPLPRWEITDPSAVPQVQFVDASHGWVLPYPDSVGPPLSLPYPDSVDPSSRRADAFAAINKLWRTSDGGRTWQSTDLPPGPDSYGVMSFVSKDSGFVLASPLNRATPSWVLYRTDDGGATWSPVATVPLPAERQPTSSVEVAPGMLVFSDMSNGLLVVGQEGPTVLRTHDGGITWSPIELPQPLDPKALLLRVTELRMFGSRVAMTAILGQKGDGWTQVDPVARNYPIYTSEDAGRTWRVAYPHEATDIPEGEGMWSILDPKTWVYLYGQTVACTRDGGATWSKTTGTGLPEGNSTIYPVFVSPDDGWALAIVQGYGMTVAITHDSGETWQLIPQGVSEADILSGHLRPARRSATLRR